MTIDECIDILSYPTYYCSHLREKALDMAIDTMHKYQQLQADYEARLKKNNELINDLEELRNMINKFAESYENRLNADMVAMLEEIDLEMSEQFFGIQTEPWEVVEKLRKEIIQQKINALRVEGEET